MKQITTFVCVVFSLCILFSLGLSSKAASLVVNSGENITLDTGTYNYDSVTIHPNGTLALLGDAKLNVTGDMFIESGLSTNVVYDPDFMVFVTNITTVTGAIDLSRNQALTSGTNGLAGPDGAWAQSTSGASPGGAGGPGSVGEINPFGLASGYYLQGYELIVNCGHDIYVDGNISAYTALPGGSGGKGGAGGRGGSGYPGTAPTNADYSYVYNGARGGNGGAGGFGGNGGYFPGGSRILLIASNNFNLGTNGAIFTASFSSGGSGNAGGAGGAGGSGGGPTLNGNLGDGGDGGHGANGGRAGNGGDIFIQGRFVNLAGMITQYGAGGGDGGRGGNGGPLQGTGGNVGIGGRGGDGGSGGKGGNGGRLVVRGLNVITNELILDQNGGPGGYGAAGGLASYGGSPGLPGGSGVDGGNGSLSIYDANNPMPSPFLWIIHSNNEVTVSWPYPSLGFLLQQNSSISTGNWTNVTQMPFDDGTNRSVTISSPTGSRFFRLHLP